MERNDKLQLPMLNKEVNNASTSPLKSPIQQSQLLPKQSSSSATGNPRNKTALKPGHSLMDWIRLGNSGTDLTGTGGRVQPVSHAELAKHDRLDDAWMAIRGKVYNVTRYMNFHPGGADELIRGIGKDATKLFEEVHAWVNYESLLAKCYVGPLRNTATVTLGDGKIPSSKLPPPPPSFLTATTNTMPSRAAKETLTINPLTASERPDPSDGLPESESPGVSIVNSGSDDSLKLSVPIVPRFDWIQKTSELTLIFYTRSLANPGVVVECVDHLEVTVTLLLEASVEHRYRFHLTNNVQWPCTARTSLETGKIELMFTKLCPALWTSYGQMTYERCENCEMQLHEYDVATRVEITHDSCALLLRPKNNCLLQVTPVGYHVSVSASIEGGEYVSRSYTPVPAAWISTDCPATSVPLLVKSYQDGCLSKQLTRPAPLATSLQLSQPSGNFALSKLRHHNRFALLAAGSGLTPMLALLDYLLDRTSNRIEHICLLYFNKTEADIWCRERLENLCKKDKRFILRHILSETTLPDLSSSPSATTSLSVGSPQIDGPSDAENHASYAHGRISLDIVRQLTTQSSPLYASYCCLCGPKPFNELCLQHFRETDHNPNHLHCFQG
ncbi:cytochrome b5 reductase 4 [Anopheles ziemanni]|uniref:cytochrome b5 reductase 4 n=1 Tax=Anopheles coustani TaxID=139045 RepID=UPI0026587EDF|nr:cytochrome b5 reductase 4 [Anopheles coustani]XP_058171125.1 cytochrome b5 reductase 4 [Anopheles ziemanni]